MRTAIDTNTAAQIAAAATINHKRPVASVLERDMPRPVGTRVKCPKCELRNVITGQNVKCKGCGFMIRVHLTPDHERYVRGLDVTPSGRDTYDIGDFTADALRGLDADGAIRVTANTLAQLDRKLVLSKAMEKATREIPWTLDGITVFLAARYEGRNNGMVRMNCGNILRNAIEKDDGNTELAI